MSAINTLIKRDSVHLITDAASYDAGGGELRIDAALGSKLTKSRLHASREMY